MSKKAEMEVSMDTATEWHEIINNRFKAAFIKQYSPTIRESVFNFEKFLILCSLKIWKS